MLKLNLHMRFTLTALMASAFLSLSAQSFQALPEALAVQEVQLELANEVYIYFDDFSADTLHLSWALEEAFIPDGWDIDLCDYGACYTSIPPAKTMLPAPGLDQPYLKLIVQPDTYTGSAWLWFKVHQVQAETEVQNVYFSLFTPGVVSAGAPAIRPQLQVWPNPASDLLYLQSPEPLPAQIVNAAGASFWNGILNGNTSIHTDNWPSGLYFLISNHTSKRIIIR